MKEMKAKRLLPLNRTQTAVYDTTDRNNSVDFELPHLDKKITQYLIVNEDEEDSESKNLLSLIINFRNFSQ